MDNDIVAKMRAEEADLTRKLKAVRDFLAAYGETPSAEANSPVRGSRPQSVGREKVEITSFTEQTRRSVVLAMQAMTTTNALMKTKDLVAFVEAMGHTITGQNKVNALGALLARSIDIQGHGKSGWSLVNRDRALEIVSKYVLQENEPVSNDATGSDAGGWGAPTPSPSLVHSSWGRTA
ncbi:MULTISPECIES: hypothetical protein [Sphingomonadales]|jgi:hypothetical protein|uniref:hypothetical protein n=1 Tax=Sphingomonadales TaxID=204457 RepID=UPI000825C24D|nr:MULTISPECIES: hypothetical protein [Sphingomonadales]